jgi:hypothetical protein
VTAASDVVGDGRTNQVLVGVVVDVLYADALGLHQHRLHLTPVQRTPATHKHTWMRRRRRIMMMRRRRRRMMMI